MSVYTEVELRCDGAGGPYECEPAIYANTVAQAREAAKKAGWLVGRPGGKDYCVRPEHRPGGAR
ncbi:hypothetical protein [Actinoplanes teichomyceticus]|uniref:Uncharacterized protein n=1 Tax=Actinoplanes teichomyceticus TaxID=1867 RepID=A0A561WAX7_ACTTI|nr:hypothetical protein [Actinoplanes teichomyceticus]TWG21009.1 hypothetical protein FHX34_103538 [Actinoplanes teichomyceticus]GIF14830.1 hypothetical protein Ate01nite_48620 [Actinoplanes teichomyceticus]